MSSNSSNKESEELDKALQEAKSLRNELAMTKQDLKKSQIAVGTAVTLLKSVGGQLVRINLLQSQAQGITAEVINGIEKVISSIPASPQQQQQNEQQQQQ